MNKRFWMWTDFILGPISIGIGIMALLVGSLFGIVNIMLGGFLFGLGFYWKENIND